ncbi:efflux RND transporter periplasmic adaptor subunit [Sulfurirhabdus autotrophica]|uniref:HlyD family secretion protein n=1 Tax=Sulfurirhabdus autotrophica TaxID=1706046 RepID=A0A4R3YF18_9PROT|nr:HlyD family efflux transporter periplasmic adaptor subunit [Sulfurirhabdus autotrophica]TCV90716.1 HlyD family secretion protein [Sulfurirhabdus autotrophica]
MKWTKRAFPLLAVLVIIGIFIWAFLPKPVTVQVAEVTQGAFQQIIEEDGKTRVRERYIVSAPLTGKLQRISLKAGDAIQQNQVVALIVASAPALLDARSERELKERVGAAEAQKEQSTVTVARILATLEKTKADLKRAKQLAANKFISAAQLDQTELDVKINTRELEAAKFAEQAAKHEVAVARAAFQQFHCDADCEKLSGRHWQIRSPVSGRVLKIVQESELVVPIGAPLLEIGNPADLEVVADILSSDAVMIPPGAKVQMKGWGRSEPLLGQVRRIEPSAFTKVSALGVEEQRVNVVIDLTSPPDQWLNLGDGFKVDTQIIVFSTDKATKTPVSSLFRKGNQWAVFVAKNGRAETRTVKIARRSGLDAMVESGLKVGEKVILYPGDLVKDGIKIKPQE